MPSLAQHQSLRFVKALFLGDPGAGKTGALTSLVAAGYALRVFDFDNLLGTLVQYVQRECPERASAVAFQTFTDKMKGIDMPVTLEGKSVKVFPFTDGPPKAFITALKQMNHWKTDDEDLGPAARWGDRTVLVIDSLTSMSAAAFRYAQAMNPMAKEPQTYYFTAQQLLTNTLALLCSKDFETNVVVIAHIAYSQNHLDITKGFPRSIGSALNEQIAAYFNCVLLAESQGAKRIIRTNSTGIVDLKNPVSFKIPETLPLNTGLATFFEAVKAPTKES